MADKTPPKPDADKNDQRSPQGQPPNRMNRNLFGYLLIFGLIATVVFMITNAQNQARDVKWGAFKAHVDSGNFEQITIKESEIVGQLRDDIPGSDAGARIRVELAPNQSARTLSDYIYENAPDVVTGEFPSGYMFLLMNLLPWILIFGVIWFIFFRAMRSSGGGMGGMLGNFGRSKHKVVNKEMTSVTLDDVAGVDESKDEVQEIIEFLKHPKKFQRLGGRIPRGVLLMGSPGCGKTLLAKAVAGEAEVPFFSISGSDFVEMFVGVGASRVRDLFKQAKENAPCIIFLDEIDAVGRRRGQGFASGGHDEREQTLNAILVEMDGFESSDQVIVVAATNRADVLDPALTRPGRFDRQITVPLPDVKGRFQILKVHAKSVKMSPDVDLERLAKGTPTFSGADLAAIINEAAIIATMENKDFVEMSDLEEARDKVRFGRANRSRRIEEEERVSTAYHEAGHAVIQAMLDDADPVHKVTIIPRGPYLGATMSLPDKDRYGMARKYVLASMRVLCGGRIAEQRKTADVTSGAMGDIRMATDYARRMVMEWGMSERLGFVDYAADHNANQFVPEKTISDDTARIADEEVKRIIDEAYKEAERIIEANWQAVVNLAEALLKFETLTADEVKRLMAGERLDKPTVSELLDAESKKMNREQETPRARPAADDGKEDDTDADAIPSPA